MAERKKRKIRVKLFSSLEEENEQEYVRRKNMTDAQRLLEFSILQERRWGANWTSKPIVKIITLEKLF